LRHFVKTTKKSYMKALLSRPPLMLAREGYAFKTISDVIRTPVMIPSLNFNVPLYAPGHTAPPITGIRHALEEDLLEKHVALIVMEGVGSDEFLWPHKSCQNGAEWYYYEPGEAQYLTITSGEHRFLDYPTGCLGDITLCVSFP